MSEDSDVVGNPYNPIAGAVFSAGPGPELRLSVGKDCGRFSLRISQANLASASAAFGADIPADIGAMSSTSGRTALCLGPDEWLLLTAQSDQQEIAHRFAELSTQISHCLVDVSHRTHTIEVAGAAAAAVLNAGCPLDLDAMPAGSCTRTILDKAQVVLMKLQSDHYRLEIVRSFAEFAWNFLTVAGREVGLEHRRTNRV